MVRATRVAVATASKSGGSPTALPPQTFSRLSGPSRKSRLKTTGVSVTFGILYVVAESDQSVVGVTSPNSKNDREVIDQINAAQQAFKDKVRRARLQRLPCHDPAFSAPQEEDVGRRPVRADDVTASPLRIVVVTDDITG